MNQKKIGLAIAAVLLTAVTATVQANAFTGKTTVVALTVDSKDGRRISQFFGFVDGEDVPQAVIDHPEVQKFDNQKDLLTATAMFLAQKAQQDDIALLTDNTNNISALFRDMRAHGITIPNVACLSKVNNVTEVIAMHAGVAGISQYARNNNIDVTGIEQNPILRANCVSKIYQQLLVDDNTQRKTATA